MQSTVWSVTIEDDKVFSQSIKQTMIKAMAFTSLAGVGFCIQTADAFQVKIENKIGLTMRVSCTYSGQDPAQYGGKGIIIQPKHGSNIRCNGSDSFEYDGKHNYDMWVKQFNVRNFGDDTKVAVRLRYKEKDGSEADYCTFMINYDPVECWNGGCHRFYITPSENNCTQDYLRKDYPDHWVARGAHMTVRITGYK